MKKYRISRFYREFYLSALFFMLALKIMFILMTIFLCDETARIYTLDIHIIEILVIALLFYMFFLISPRGNIPFPMTGSASMWDSGTMIFSGMSWFMGEHLVLTQDTGGFAFKACGFSCPRALSPIRSGTV